ncbi:MAG: hypothetical protein KH425_00190 [Prevotella bivia]|nr:hypothetical protein [Prevotella bivia]
MKKIFNFYTLFIALFSSLMFISCTKENEVEVKDYAFKASLQIIDDAGKVHDVGTPIKFRINLEDIKDRGDSLEITMSVGERKAEVYSEEKTSVKHKQNEMFRDAFRNNSVILNYVPINGGKQTVKFTIVNGKYSYSLEKEVEVSTGTIITFTPLEPLKQILYSDGSHGEFSINNYKDEDNYYTLKFEVLEGKKNCTFNYDYTKIENKEDKGRIISLKDGEERRIFEGKGHALFNYTYNQHEEGNNTIKLTIKDRYGNEESRTYQLFYSPLVNVRFTLVAGYKFDQPYIYKELELRVFSDTKNSLGELKGYPIYSDDFMISFDMTYISYNISTKKYKKVTRHITCPISGYEFSKDILEDDEYMKIPNLDEDFKIENIKILGLTSKDGRRYTVYPQLDFTGFSVYVGKNIEKSFPINV